MDTAMDRGELASCRLSSWLCLLEDALRSPLSRRTAVVSMPLPISSPSQATEYRRVLSELGSPGSDSRLSWNHLVEHL